MRVEVKEYFFNEGVVAQQFDKGRYMGVRKRHGKKVPTLFDMSGTLTNSFEDERYF